MAQVPQVFIFGIIRFSCNFQGDIVCLCVRNFLFARFDIPLSPRGDNRHFRGKSFDCQLKTHLVVALSGAAVANRVRAFFLGNFHQALCNQRTGKARTQHIVLVQCAGLDGGNDEVVDKLLGQVFHIQLRSARFQCLFLEAVQLRSLADIAGNSNDFAVIVVFFQPRNNNGSI